MAKKKGGGKKGGGAKKGGGEKKPKGPFVGHILDGPKPVSTEQIMVRKPAGAFLTVQVRHSHRLCFSRSTRQRIR